jgi:hypothetical protein
VDAKSKLKALLFLKIIANSISTTNANPQKDVTVPRRESQLLSRIKNIDIGVTLSNNPEAIPSTGCFIWFFDVFMRKKKAEETVSRQTI